MIVMVDLMCQLDWAKSQNSVKAIHLGYMQQEQ